MTPSADPEIVRILQEPEGDTARDHLELLSVLANRIVPAGMIFPPPTLGTYALLSCIRSPFLASTPGRISRPDAAAALLILSRPKQAAGLLLRRAVCEERFARCSECSEGIKPEPIRKILADERDFRKDWDRELRRFDRRLGTGERNWRRIADALQLHLAPGIGFSMLPEPDRSDPQAFNLETVARIAAGVAEIIPGITPEQLLWRIPMPLLGMLLVQTVRKHGLPGVSRDEKTRRLWQRFQELQQGTDSSRPRDMQRSRRAKAARRHFRRIHSGADLYPFPGDPADKAGKVTDPTRSVKSRFRTSNEKARGVFPGSIGSEHSTANGERNGWIRKVADSGTKDCNWSVRADFAGMIRPAVADPMHQLANSVVRIENLLKRQLPDGVV